MQKFIILCAVGAISVGCKSEQELAGLRWDDLALVSGDFDNMGENLTRLGIDYTEYEGFISKPVYNPDIDPASFALTVDGLLQGTTDSGKPVMNAYDVVFINSGTRGLGSVAYNSMDTDDQFVSDSAVIENISQFTSKSKSLVISDWGGDLIEAVWPEAIQFINEAECDRPPCWDAWQAGTSEQVIATVTDQELQQKLGTDSISLQFDFSYWSVMESVADDVDVYLRGDVEYRISGAEGYGTLEDVPLLVGFSVAGGRVIFSSFHWSSQNSAIADTVMVHVAEGLTPKL